MKYRTLYLKGSYALYTHTLYERQTNQIGPLFFGVLIFVWSFLPYSFSSLSISLPFSFSFLSPSPLFSLLLGFLAPGLFFGSQPGCPNIQNSQP